MLEIFWRKKTYQVKNEIDAFVDIDAYAEIEKNHAKLQDENKRLKEKIKKICVGIDAPKFEPDKIEITKIDLTKPELAYLWGWESAILECGEILSKP